MLAFLRLIGAGLRPTRALSSGSSTPVISGRVGVNWSVHANPRIRGGEAERTVKPGADATWTSQRCVSQGQGNGEVGGFVESTCAKRPQPHPKSNTLS